MSETSAAPQTLSQYVLQLPKREGSGLLGVSRKNGSIDYHSSSDYFIQIKKLSLALLVSGLKRGNKIAILSNSRMEWSICDLGSICAGGIVVPLYPNMTTEEMGYILNHSECQIIFVENRLALRQLMVIREKCPSLQKIILIDAPTQKEFEGWISLDEFLEAGDQLNQGSRLFEQSCQMGHPLDPATILYTSGTTGQPKGVVLTHSQIISEVLEAFQALQINPSDKTLSFLPFSHVLGRTEHWGHLIIGYTMVYSAGNERLPEELQKIEPTVIVAVPRIFEKIYTTLKAKIETSSLDLSIFNRVYKIGLAWSEYLQDGNSPSLQLQAEFTLAKTILFDRLKKQLFGSQLRFAVCGGAPLSREILRFFHACGILIVEGYGLTETTGAICVNRPYDFEFGTVGKPLHRTSIKIASDGEILVKGPTVTREYYKDPDSSFSIKVDDWFHTGDIGEITSKGRLVIRDRKKDLIKTANGKYIAPQKLEGMFKQLPFISHAHIHGDQKKYIVALLTLNKNFLFADARAKGISFKSLEDLKNNSEVIAMIRAGVAEINLKLASHETIKNYAVLSEDFSIENGELTPSLKVKRRVVDRKYQELIESLYA